jgi:PST family polysaccharide transporter
VRGGILTVASQAGRLGLQLASTMALARLLAPEQFGVFAMATAVTGFFALFREMGLSTATVQKDEVTHAQVSLLFWVNTGMGLLIGAVMLLLASPIAGFFGVPEVAGLVRVLALGPVLGGAAVQHQALLQRQMRFGAIGAVNVSSMLAGAVAGVALAWGGAGTWSLAALSLVTELVYTAASWWACRWRPGWPRRGTGARGMLRFGGNLVGVNLSYYLARNLDKVLLGRFAGAAALGLYSRAYALLTMPLQQVNAPLSAVALPALSRLVNEPEGYRRAYCSLAEKIQMVSVPGIALLLVCADWVTRILLGPGWEGAALLYTLLGLAGIVQPLTNTTGWLFLTQGRAAEALRWSLTSGALTVLSFVAGLPWGAVGVAAGYGIVSLLLKAPLGIWYVSRHSPVSQADLYGTMRLPGLAALAVAASTWGLRQATRPQDPVLGLAVALPLAIAATLIVYGSHPRGRKSLAEAGQMLLQH